MNSVDCLKVFKTRPWTSEQEVAAFAQEVEALETADVLRLLQFLTVAGAPATPGHGLGVLAVRLLAERFPDPRLFAHFVGALRAADPALRAALASLLPKMNSILDHPALCALMRSPDAALRSTAAGILSQVGAKTAFDLLSEMVREPSLQSRRELIGVLVAIGEHRAVGALQAALGFAPRGPIGPSTSWHPHAAWPDAGGRGPIIATAVLDSSESVAAHAITSSPRWPARRLLRARRSAVRLAQPRPRRGRRRGLLVRVRARSKSCIARCARARRSSASPRSRRSRRSTPDA
jgi:hypothetical protein